MMNRKLIWVLISGVSLALVGLILVQWYWIRNAANLKEEQFGQVVNRSLSKIAHEIQQHEAAGYLVDEVERISYDSLIGFPSLIIPEMPLFPAQGNLAPFKDHQTITFRDNGSGNISANVTIIGRDTFHYESSGHGSQVDSRIYLNDRLVMTHRFRARVADMNTRKLLVDKVIQKMMEAETRIEDRIDDRTLSKALQDEFKSHGIHIPFEFAVMGEDQKTIFKSQGFDESARDNLHLTRLFPDDLFSRPNYLAVYFPSEQRYIFSTLGFMASSSIVLTLVIILTFSLTIFIILRQKRLSEIKTDFVNNMTHELKTPISTISLASQLLNDKSIPIEAKNLDHLSRMIQDESKRLGYQVEKVLQMAIFDKGHLDLKIKQIDMLSILNNACSNFHLQVKSKEGSIVTDFRPMNYTVQGDEVHLTNAINNLIDNAIKYSPHHPVISVATRSKKGYLIVEVTDNGLGISKEDQKRIFEKFYRVPTGNVHNVKGFGLGLSYVKKIAEDHGGRITLDSEPGKGSSFRLWLPLSETMIVKP
jgi:two-component system, OmpR family, phosphate regulon sensor histidine kinase PhoR